MPVPERHNPYDLSLAAPVDSTDVYRSRPDYLWAFPRYVWGALIYPLGKFAIYAEHGKLLARYYSLFVNEAGTFGLFPYAALGGETGTGGGAQMFYVAADGSGRRFTGFYIYAGGTGQTGEGLYVHPNVLGSGLTWRLEGGLLRTRNEDATINGAIPDDPVRRFQIDRVDVRTALGWQQHSGRLAPYLRNFSIEGRLGFGRRDFRAWTGGSGPLVDAGSTPEARLLRGLGTEYSLVRFGGRVAYDDRDYRHPTRDISHPLNYKFPGRVVAYEDGLYYYYRDLGYPERGGLAALEAELVSGSKDARFYRVAAELQRYVTLFWRNRILAVRARVEKVRRVGNGFVPYPDLVALGGENEMRGYHRGFFRGQGALVFNVEYRYPIWDTWNAFLFWDEGQVFDHFKEVGLDRFRTSWGGGISLRTEVGLLGKVHAGHSAQEKVLIGLSLEQAF